MASASTASGATTVLTRPAGFRVLGTERPAHHQQRKRARLAHQPRRDQARGRFRHEAEADEGRGKPRVARRRPRDRNASASWCRRRPRCPARRRPAAFRSAPARRESAGSALPERAAADRHLQKIADVVAGGETVGRAGDQHAAQRRILRRALDAPRPWRRTSPRSARSSCPAGSSARCGPARRR